MPRSHTDLIDELTKRVDALALALEGVRTTASVEIAHIKEGLKDLQGLAKELQLSGMKLSERVAAIEQRCTALEKGADRTWQFVPLIISAIAVLVSLVVAFVKK